MKALSDEIQEDTQAIVRFFEQSEKGAFLFAVANDELLLRRTNETIRFLLEGKQKQVAVFSWRNNASLDRHPLYELEDFLTNNPNIKGLLLTDLDYTLRPDQNPNILSQLNLTREALRELDIPLLFWVSSRSLTLFIQNAIDLYDQRSMATFYFDSQLDTNLLDATDRFVVAETAQANPNIAQHQARLKLLHEQLHRAEQQQLDPKIIANDIVLPLLEIYTKIPGTEKPIIKLLKQYSSDMNLNYPNNCFRLGVVHQHIEELEKAEKYYLIALKIDTEETGFPNVAIILNNLANLHRTQSKLISAEKEHKEALKIRRKLAQQNPQIYLPDLATTLNNLANLYIHKNELLIAEKTHREALKIRRKLAQQKTHTNLFNLAITLNNLGYLHNQKKDFTNAESTYQEALKIHRQQAQDNPQIYLPHVAMSLSNLANLHYDKNEFATAEKEYNEALYIYKKLSLQSPQTFLLSVSNTCLLLSIFYQKKNPNKTKSLSFAKETLEIALPFEKKLPAIKKMIDTALQVIKNWGLDADVFLAEIRAQLKKNNNPDK
jgi:tetratricopeptide (TPR) repeat protein